MSLATLIEAPPNPQASIRGFFFFSISAMGKTTRRGKANFVCPPGNIKHLPEAKRRSDNVDQARGEERGPLPII